jgi:(1->4)-alpha-D-glucan 1-alpha-D-glucosylmutase
MGIGDPGNYRWLDVLENGPASIYAGFFDINWRPMSTRSAARPKIVVPTLGDQYGKVLENGELRVVYGDGELAIAYYDQRFPVAPDAYVQVLQPVLERLEASGGLRDEHNQDLASILTALRHLPPRDHAGAQQVEERNREKEVQKRRLRALHEDSAQFRDALERVLEAFNGQGGVPESFDLLDALIDDQSYRLAFWRVAAEEINYRRFFDITELAAVRMEDPEVFADTHRLLLRLVGEGKVWLHRSPDGGRTRRVLRELQQQCLERLDPGATRSAITSSSRRSAGDERLRPTAVSGMTATTTEPAQRTVRGTPQRTVPEHDLLSVPAPGRTALRRPGQLDQEDGHAHLAG